MPNSACWRYQPDRDTCTGHAAAAQIAQGACAGGFAHAASSRHLELLGTCEMYGSRRSLYFAALMMLIGSGSRTYLALRLAADHVDSLWVGALMAANYFVARWARSATG